MQGGSRSLHESIRDLPYGFTNSYKLFDTAKGSLSLVQRLSLQRKLPVHNGCVNSICWNDRGEYILSGSDDQHLCVTHGYNYNVTANVQTGHRANIFSARFLPNTSDNQVISCSGDGIVIFSDLQKPQSSFSNVFNCHFGTAYEIMTVPNDSHTFLSCGEDGTVRWFDLRIKNSCSNEDCKEDILINCRCAVTTLAVNPLTPYHLGVGCSDSSVRIFDRRMLGTRATGSYIGNGIQAMVSRFTVPEFEGQTHRITSLSYSPDGSEMLVSYSSDYIYLFDVKDDAQASPKILKGRNKSSKAATGGRCKSSERPLMKRLRVRGDWSDTGPNARPESEATTSQEQHSRSLHANLLQRMSDVLTRMFNNSGSTAAATNENASNNNPPVETPAEPIPPSAIAVEPSSEEPATSQPGGATSSSSFSSPASFAVDTPKIERNASEDDEQNAESSKPVVDTPIESAIKVSSTNSGEETTPVEAISEAASVNQSLQQMKQEITNTKERGSAEPVFNLTFSGHGVQSGVISINTPTEPLIVQPTEPTPLIGNTTELPNNPSILISEDMQTDDSIPSSSKPKHSEAMPSASKPSVPMETEENWDYYQSSDDEDENDDDDRPSYTSGRNSAPLDNPGPSTASPKSKSLFSKLKSETSLNKEPSQMNVPLPRVKCKFTGHRNARTMIKEATFWGDRFIMSGSDCGHIFVWDRDSTKLVMIMEADHHVVNCLQPHPFDPILASSGIDYDVKLWAPLKEEPFFDEPRASEIMERNKVMLEETKDTITVPASFMIRMLASLNDLRSAGGGSIWRRVVRQAARDTPDQQ